MASANLTASAQGLKRYTLTAYTSQIGASPVVAYVAGPKRGRIIQVKGVQSAAITGTSAIAVAINGGTAIASLALSMTGGGAGTEFSSTVSTTDALTLNGVTEDDVISLTPSGATGSATGTFTVVIET
jgi:hypothetical protein